MGLVDHDHRVLAQSEEERDTPKLSVIVGNLDLYLLHHIMWCQMSRNA